MRLQNSPRTKNVTIIAENQKYILTVKEYKEWNIYAKNHPWLFRIGYNAILNMFLTNFRMGCNLNKKVKT